MHCEPESQAGLKPEPQPTDTETHTETHTETDKRHEHSLTTDCIYRPRERRMLHETAQAHLSPAIQEYILREASKPAKQWVHEVLAGKREADRVQLRTADFVLLPDVSSIFKRRHRYSHPQFHKGRPCELPHKDQTFNSQKSEKASQAKETDFHPEGIFWQGWRAEPQSKEIQLHWLAVVTDTSLRTLRDLRGEHVPMLQALHAQACQRISDEFGLEQTQIMAYIHYPPSVYHLHVHFKHLSSNQAFDTARVHPLLAVINNLQIDPDFYAKSCLYLPVYTHTELYLALSA